MPKVKTILCIDDESSIRDVLETALTRRNYKVITAINAEEAVPHLGEADLVITDIHQPESKGGYWLLDQARAQYPGLNVILMSADHIDHERAEGAAGQLSKPFDLSNLITTVEKYAPKKSKRDSGVYTLSDFS